MAVVRTFLSKISRIFVAFACMFFATLMPITANAATCSAGYYLVSQNVPAGYTELEYIESTGTQYIDTGYIVDYETFKIESKAIKHTGYSLFGADPLSFTGMGDYIYYYYGSGTQYGKHVPTNPYSPHVFVLDTGKLYIDGELKSPYASGVTGKTPGALYLFARNVGGRINDAGSHRVYYFKIWDGNTLVFDLIPARRNSDGEVGMYDTVTGTFFANSGTGTFVAGADVGTCAACPSNNTYVATYCPGDNQIHNCPTASYYASRVTDYGYWTSDGIHNTVNGCRAYITEQDPTGDYGLSCEIYNGDYGVDGGAGQCMAEWVGWCAAGRYAPYDNPNTNVVWRQSVEAMVGEVCVDVGVGYYSPADDLNRYACTNSIPANSHYSGSGGATNNCPFECDSGYLRGNDSCSLCPDGTYTFDPDITPTDKTYDNTNKTWSINTSYGSVSGIAVCNDTAGSGWAAVTSTNFPTGTSGQHCWCKMTSPAVSAWVYNGDASTASGCDTGGCAYYCANNLQNGSAQKLRAVMFGSAGCQSCTDLPSNAHWTSNGTAANNCSWTCDSGYTEYMGACHARCPYGDGELHVGQYTHPLWADITNVPSPSVYIGELGPNHDGLCYAYLEPDDTPVDNHHGFHTVHNGVPYHAINLGLYGLE